LNRHTPGFDRDLDRRSTPNAKTETHSAAWPISKPIAIATPSPAGLANIRMQPGAGPPGCSGGSRLNELRRGLLDESFDLTVEALDLGIEGQPSLGQVAQGSLGRGEVEPLGMLDQRQQVRGLGA
jgi:hypothetical protein